MTEAPRRILLVGLPGAGKSTVGALLAATLGWEFVDTDAEIERRTGRAIPELFSDPGEAAFRALESETVAAAAARERVVIAPGGGWIEGAGNLAGLPPRSLVVHLRTAAGTAAARLAAGGEVRPLLAGADPLAALRELERRRLPLYERAHLEIPGDGEPAQVCARIAAALPQLIENAGKE